MTWNTTTVPYMPPSYSYTCTESSLSPAPGLVENFTVNDYFINGSQISLDLDWSPPIMPNGELTPYNICIGGEPLDATEELVGTSGGHTCTSRSHLESVSYGRSYESCMVISGVAGGRGGACGLMCTQPINQCTPYTVMST